MQHATYTPTLWTVWGQTFSLLTQTSRWVAPILLGFFFIPQFCLEIWMGYQGIVAADAIQHAVAVQDQVPTIGGYLSLLESFYLFLGPYLGGFLGLALVLLTGYLVLILFFLQSCGEESPRSLPQLCWHGVKLLLPKGIPFVGFLLILSVEQLFFSSLHVFSAFALLAIVISLHEKQGMWRSLGHALFFRYTNIQRGGAFRMAFILIMTMSFVSMARIGLEVLFLQFHLEGAGMGGLLPASFSAPVWGMPFSPLGLVGHCLRIAGYSVLLAFLAGFSVTLYREASPSLAERMTL